MRWGRQRWGISDSITNKRRKTVTMDRGQQTGATVRGAFPTLLRELLCIFQKQYSEDDFMEFAIIRKYLIHMPGNWCGCSSGNFSWAFNWNTRCGLSSAWAPSQHGSFWVSKRQGRSGLQKKVSKLPWWKPLCFNAQALEVTWHH